ncbi:hypothetical protein C8Q74DRAFT_1365740 [Fomes fomentarius]|nr:hypothetical protein C8Q74DRAFT_1365740 [Fomes fomentarius]
MTLVAALPVAQILPGAPADPPAATPSKPVGLVDGVGLTGSSVVSGVLDGTLQNGVNVNL